MTVPAVDKYTLTAGLSTATISGGKSIAKEDSFVNSLLDSSFQQIINGEFTCYGSDILALASLSATLFLVGWRIYQDTKGKDAK